MGLSSDARQAWVEFRSRPWISAVAVLMLALGVAGATTTFAMLSAAGAVMVPPGIDAARVARIAWTSSDQDGSRSPLSAEEYAQLRSSLRGGGVFDIVAAWTDERTVIGGAGGRTVSVKRVSHDFFQAFDFKASAGRLFTSFDSRASSPRVAVVRDGLRARLDGLDPGRVVRLGGEDYSIVGILPDRCWYPGPDTDLWLPLEETGGGVPAASMVNVTSRLRSSDAAVLDRARTQVAAIGGRMQQSSTVRSDRSRRLSVITLQADVGKRLGFGLLGLVGPAVVVLLITCGNTANLLLARAARRDREMAVRAALGASRWRLVRERMAESALLGGLGGAFGLALAVAAVRLLRAWAAGGVESARLADILHLDGRAVVFTVCVTLAIPFVFGLVPAVSASKPNLTQSLHSAPGFRRPRRGPYGGRDLLVIVEMGLAVILVVCALMFSRFFTEMSRIEWGFDPSKVLAVDLSLDRTRSGHEADVERLADILDAVRQVPGVRSAAAGGLPGIRSEGERQPIEFEGCDAVTGRVGAVAVAVGPHYFSTIALAVRRGRGITEMDTAGAARVVVISEQHANRCWPGRDPIGRRVRRQTATGAEWLTVVGVVPNTMVTRVFAQGPQAVYVPYAQTNSLPGTLLVRADSVAPSLVDGIRAAVRRADPTQPLEDVHRVDEALLSRLSGAAMAIGFVGGFGAFALALGALGVFSVTSYMVAERTREFGIRIALGATRGMVLRLVLEQALVIVGIGTAVSFAGTLAVTRLGFREMADLAITDPVLWASVCGLLVSVAIGAAIVPARRAMRVEPMVALRAE